MIWVCLFLFFLTIRRPPGSTLTCPLFPYTTLFRSDARVGLVIIRKGAAAGVIDFVRQIPHPAGNVPALVGRGPTEPGIDRCESLAPDVIFDFGIASEPGIRADPQRRTADRKSTRLNSSH